MTSPAEFTGTIEYIQAIDSAAIGELLMQVLWAPRTRGDEAVREFSLRFDKVSLD